MRLLVHRFIDFSNSGVANRLVDMTALLGNLATSSRNFH